MKIALYGQQDEADKKEERLYSYFQASGVDVEIDVYTIWEALLNNISQYDVVCLTEQSVDLITGGYSSQVVFEWGKQIRTCNANEIYYVEADLKNVHIWFAKTEMTVPLSFSHVGQILEDTGFIKVHRSYMVNYRYIRNIGDHTVTLKDGKVLPLSKYRRTEVRKQYAEYMRNCGKQLNTEKKSK